jgi:hypothetical protein
MLPKPEPDIIVPSYTRSALRVPALKLSLLSLRVPTKLSFRRRLRADYLHKARDHRPVNGCDRQVVGPAIPSIATWVLPFANPLAYKRLGS